MVERDITKFEIPKFNRKNFTIWRIKIYIILVKNNCAIALKGKILKSQKMIVAKFDEKYEIIEVDILLALDD